MADFSKMTKVHENVFSSLRSISFFSLNLIYCEQKIQMLAESLLVLVINGHVKNFSFTFTWLDYIMFLFIAKDVTLQVSKPLWFPP